MITWGQLYWISFTLIFVAGVQSLLAREYTEDKQRRSTTGASTIEPGSVYPSTSDAKSGR